MSNTERIEARAAIVMRFIERLGDVTAWTHTGEIIELERATGHCVCGHPIKFLFPIVHNVTGRTEHIGSECIHHFMHYSPSLYAALCATIERKKAETKAAEEARQQAAVDAIAEEYFSLIGSIRKRYEALYGGGWCNDRDVWYAVNKAFLQKPKRELKTVSGYVRWYTRQKEEVKAFINQHPEFSPS